MSLDGVATNFGSMKVEVPKGVDGRTRDILERCMETCGKAAGARTKMRSRARKEASLQDGCGFYKPFAETKKFEYKSWVNNEVFDLLT